MKFRNVCMISSMIAIAVFLGGCSAEKSTEDTQITEQKEVVELEMKQSEIDESVEEAEAVINNAAEADKKVSFSNQSQIQGSFYGIWCLATKNYTEACEHADKLKNAGFYAQVIDTDMWSNLNDGWYAVTAGVYDSKEAANADLSSAKANYKDAYVKYSGNYIGQNQANSQQNTSSQDNAMSDSNAVVAENPPFYGIWCQATTDYNEAEMYANEFRNLGYAAIVINTNEWSNLNNGWYAVSVGIYDSKENADAVLSDVKAYYNDAYVKYSGNYQ